MNVGGITGFTNPRTYTPPVQGAQNQGAFGNSQGLAPQGASEGMKLPPVGKGEEPGGLPENRGEGSKGKAAGAEKNAGLENQGCHTCENRKYQDVSDDAGVSFQTPTKLSPGQAAGAVAAHEREHVTREQSKADREGRKVISQTVSLKTDICSECGVVYIAGGVTRTTTKGEAKQEFAPMAQDKGRFIDLRA